MAVGKLLVDSNFLHALSDRTDKYHQTSVAFARQNTRLQVIPDVVLTEVTHSLNRLVGEQAVRAFLQVIVLSDIELQPITKPDIQRAYDLMAKYDSARLDFVDCCIMALSERLNIPQICTFDRRDFTKYRRPNGDALELFP